jgi:hypothetical protein
MTIQRLIAFLRSFRLVDHLDWAVAAELFVTGVVGGVEPEGLIAVVAFLGASPLTTGAAATSMTQEAVFSFRADRITVGIVHS